jgi:ATP-dependent Clp protease ATP-binding subunit ClpA
MFERFTRQARAAVQSAVTTAFEEDAERVEGMHLLRALIAVGPTARAAILALGADADELAEEARRRTVRPARRAGLTDDDVDAIRSLGIDVDALLSKVELDLGSEALAPRRRRTLGRRLGGAVPFSTTSRKALELALRHALRVSDREINDAHLLVGLIRADEPTRALLAEQGITEIRLLEWLRRRPDSGGGAVPAYA